MGVQPGLCRTWLEHKDSHDAALLISDYNFRMFYVPSSEPESLFNNKVTVRNFSASRRLHGKLSIDNSVILFSVYLAELPSAGLFE